MKFSGYYLYINKTIGRFANLHYCTFNFLLVVVSLIHWGIKQKCQKLCEKTLPNLCKDI